MKHLTSTLIVCSLAVVLHAAAAGAQTKTAGFDYRWSDSCEEVDKNHWRCTGSVEFWRGDMRFYADKADYWEDTHRLIATGNVTVIESDNQISATSIDFNTETQTGIFYNASGMASLGDRADRALFGTLEPDMLFYGEMIEKLGNKKYRITNGGFTTCVQPEPRWVMTSGSVVLRLEHYAVLKNAVMRAKGVPVFYLPIMYYPVKTKDDSRSTGFLMPTYGSSSAHGFTLSNAFFWAMGRSEDLTLSHDWFSKTGQGFGPDFRYVRGPGSFGNLRGYILDEHEYNTTAADGTQATIPAKRSYKFDVSAAEAITRSIRASASVHYFTDIVSQQTYNMNIYDASRSSRTANVSVVGAWHGVRMSGFADRTEIFNGVTDSSRTGALPRLNFSRGEQPIGNLPIYFTLGGEYVTLQRGSTSSTTSGDVTTTTVTNDSVSRVDFSPTVRIPFTRWPFLTANTSVNWRGTYWSKSWDNSVNRNILDQSISRRFFEFTSTITGPVVSKIFNMAADSTYADKMKHTIEPSLTVDYTTAVPEFDRIIQWESIDSIVGGTTRLTYGVANRLYAKRKRDGKVLGSREIFSVGVSQTYYTNARASQFDPSYATSFRGVTANPNNFSPLAITARGTPADGLNASFRAEIDSRFKVLRTISANGSYSLSNWLWTSGGWSLTRRLDANGVVNTLALQHFLNGGANLRLAQNKYGGNYAFDYDVGKGEFVQQRITAYYNAQCCGFAVEYQRFNFGTIPGVPVADDHRLNFSFTLAGVGSFSNVFGALTGAQR